MMLTGFSSCVSLHTPPAHFTPTLTKKNQLEGEAGFGLVASNVNMAYSPLKHLSVMANVQALTFKKNNSGHYQKCAEFAVGYYGTKKRLIYGFNAGYGLGTQHLNFNFFTDTTSYSLQTSGKYQKLTLQSFIALTDNPDAPGWFLGLSLKESLYMDNYASLTNYGKERINVRNVDETNTSFEPCIFTKHFFSKRFCLTTQVGMNISYDESMFWPTQYVFLRIGAGIRLY